MVTSPKLRRPRHQKVYFLKLHMNVYLRANFEASSIILIHSFRQGGWGGGNFTPIPHPTSKQTPKKLTQIRVKKVCVS